MYSPVFSPASAAPAFEVAKMPATSTGAAALAKRSNSRLLLQSRGASTARIETTNVPQSDGALGDRAYVGARSSPRGRKCCALGALPLAQWWTPSAPPHPSYSTRAIHPPPCAPSVRRLVCSMQVRRGSFTEKTSTAAPHANFSPNASFDGSTKRRQRVLAGAAPLSARVAS